VGDLAKVGKFGKQAETLAKAIELAATNPKMAERFAEVSARSSKTLMLSPTGV